MKFNLMIGALLACVFGLGLIGGCELSESEKEQRERKANISVNEFPEEKGRMRYVESLGLYNGPELFLVEIDGVGYLIGESKGSGGHHMVIVRHERREDE